MENERDSAFELYEKISPVAILYGGGPRLFVSEHNSSRRLLKELHRLGKSGIRVRGMISERGALARTSLAALNCWLAHFYGPRSLTQIRADGLHRFAWYDVQRTVALEWVR